MKKALTLLLVLVMCTSMAACDEETDTQTTTGSMTQSSTISTTTKAPETTQVSGNTTTKTPETTQVPGNTTTKTPETTQVPGNTTTKTPETTEGPENITTKTPETSKVPETTTTKTPETEPTPTVCSHNYKVNAIKDATCTAKGSKAFTCSKCGDSYSEEIAMIAHKYTDATCTAPKTCTICKTTEGSVQHNYNGISCIHCGDPDPHPLAPSEGLEFILNEDGKSYRVSDPGTCSRDAKIVIPSQYNNLPVTAIGDEAFLFGSVKTIIVPYGVTSIGSRAFENSSITNCILPDSVTTIESGAFFMCQNLENFVIPNGITRISSSTFAYSENLKNVTIPDSVTTIGSSAFEGCTSLTGFNISDSITTIEFSAFLQLSFESIVIPANVEIIEWSAFVTGKNCIYIFCEAESKPEGWDNEWFLDNDYLISDGWPGDGITTVYWGNEWEYVNGVPTLK